MIELLIFAAAIIFDPADCGAGIFIDFDAADAGCYVAPTPDPGPDPEPPPSGGSCLSPTLGQKNFQWVCPGFSELTSVMAGAGFDIWHMGSTMVQGESLCISPQVSYTQWQWAAGQTWRVRGSNFLVLASPGAPVPPTHVELAGNNIEWRGPIGPFTVTGSNVIINGVCYQ